MASIVDVDAVMNVEEAVVAPSSLPAPTNGGHEAVEIKRLELDAVDPNEKSPTPYMQATRISPDDPELGAVDYGRVTTKQRTSIFTQASDVSGVTLRFENIEYSVELTKKMKKQLGPNAPKSKHILKGISGEIRPGNVLAIMGASGAGKTTLLNLLAGRLSSAGGGKTSGRVLVNGMKRDYDVFSRMSAYVLQDDIFFGELTVYETISLSARLRLPSSVTSQERGARVESIIAELGLSNVRDSRVGSALVRGISGGERKRVNIGTELITNPSLIFLDEPTSGLDAFNAQNVMDNLLLLARGGRTVLCTIHQPRSEIYSSLDKLMLLSEGYCVYMGAAETATDYFGRLNFQCPPQHNPSDFFLDLISLDTRSERKANTTRKRIQLFAETYHDMLASAPLPPASEGFTKSQRAVVTASKSTATYASSWGSEFSLLFKRAFTVMIRERATNIARLGQIIVFSVLLSLIWNNEGGDDATSVGPVSGVLFFLLINQSVSGVFQIIFTFPDEKSIIDKERASRSYRVSSYFWSKTLVELPRTLSANLLFGSILYPSIGLRWGAEYFFLFIVAVLLVTLAAESTAYLISAIVKTAQQAGALAPISIITSLLFGGFFIRVDDIPIWLSWLRYLSFIKYGFAAVMQIEYKDRDLNTSGCGPTGFCPASGQEVLENYELDELSFGMNLLLLIVLSVFFRLVAFWILRSKGPVFDKSI